LPTPQELRDELELRGLDTSGLKPALVERLEAAIAGGGAPAAAANGAGPAGEPAPAAPAEPAPAAATKGGQVRRRPAAPSAARPS
jgi:2-oxoglutarate dehydrogenase E2 component (dihydrolipoamide succinyltransferase)